ncbi:hypothetical protein NCS52_00990400 [Fusarium sp. LHS14.1]|nr:hypothetical protein NCS52_00990400 [Fusarium sp. LHS14.1]
MNEEDFINLMNAIGFTIGHESGDESDTRVEELASFYIDFPEAEMSMKLEDITWPTKPEGAIPYEHLVEKGQTNGTFATEKGSVTEVTEKLAKEELHVKKLIDAIHGVLLKAKEQTDEKAVLE